jgi:coenzyme F420-0:L-glutamate ligase/coenzyme F420-1:gamma-L-glutamate ligase
VIPLKGLPEVQPGDDLAALIAWALRESGIILQDDDVLVVSQKVVSKAEGALIDLSEVRPSPQALSLAAGMDRDPRHVEIILRESRRLVRVEASRGLIISETHQGFICANAGVDRSNVGGSDVVSLLPRDPDASARRISKGLGRHAGREIPVIVSDTFGRAWRRGLVDVAIGVAGLRPLLDLRGSEDASGKGLRSTVLAIADGLAAAAGLVKGKAEGLPVVIVRGATFPKGNGSAGDLLRPASEDLFR